jgi:putative hydrolase of the HAD superfamily
MKPQALLFDIGNVIVHFDFAPATERLASLSDVRADEVFERLSRFKVALETGAMNDEEFITESIALTGFRGSRADFARIWNEIFTANEPMMEFIRSMHGRVPMYLLSNTNGLHKDHLFANFDVFRLFDGGIYSHEANAMKPHEPIFQSAVDAFGLEPSQTFYIDDLADNIRTGQRLGFVSHHYDSCEHDRFDREVREWLR